MMNNFIRNPVLRTSHTIREPGYYINTIKIEHLSLVCTLANTSPCPLFYAFYHLLYLRRGSNSQSSDSYSEAFPLSYEGINSSGQPLATHLREYREVPTYTLSLSLVRCELFG